MIRWNPALGGETPGRKCAGEIRKTSEPLKLFSPSFVGSNILMEKEKVKDKIFGYFIFKNPFNTRKDGNINFRQRDFMVWSRINRDENAWQSCDGEFRIKSRELRSQESGVRIEGRMDFFRFLFSDA
ncbi:MAG: hypothetical protein KKF30_07370 [Proteobacteria bacterium]|nr:hypothetical protein [Pseudomonadota bacterium]MBU4470038.1 hypothetical protein [Pseudomonadota bacterium]MCG2753818.1 hypothetical protein [Desulfobacteraceae bacterium]